MIDIVIENMDEAARRMRENPKKVLPAIQKAVEIVGFTLEKSSKEAITTGATRAIKTGTLRSQLVPRDRSADGLELSIYPLVKYGKFVHEGTAKMRPRPFFKVAVLNSGEEVQRVFEEAVSEALN